MLLWVFLAQALRKSSDIFSVLMEMSSREETANRSLSVTTEILYPPAKT